MHLDRGLREHLRGMENPTDAEQEREGRGPMMSTRFQVSQFMPYRKEYSQSKGWKAVVYSTVCH